MQIPKILQLLMVLGDPESAPLTQTQRGALDSQGLKG